MRIDNYRLDKVLKNIKMITGIEKFDDNKILIVTDDQLSDEVVLKNVARSIHY